MKDTLSIPRLSLVLLIGPSGAGKTTLAERLFAPTECVGIDAMRAMLDDDPYSATATSDAVEMIRIVTARRLARGRLTVIDAPNVNIEERRPLIKLAQKNHAAAVAIVLNVDAATCRANNDKRASVPKLPAKVLERQQAAMKKTLASIKKEGFYRVHTITKPEDFETFSIQRETMRADRCDAHGPFDLIGDVHGCCDELETLLSKLGYAKDEQNVWRHPDNRKAVFLGDLINRGPRSLDTIRLVMDMVDADSALCVPGNHENLLVKWFGGASFPPTHGLKATLDEIDKLPADDWKALKARIAKFVKALESHLILDNGMLIAAHAGITAELAGRMNVKRFALYGETRGETDGYARRKIPLWALQYRSKARVIYGHCAVTEPKRSHNTLNIDTGCVFGGELTALRYPEGELVTVPAAQVYMEPDPQHARPQDEVEPPKADAKKDATAAKTEATATKEKKTAATPAPETEVTPTPETEATATPETKTEAADVAKTEPTPTAETEAADEAAPDKA